MNLKTLSRSVAIVASVAASAPLAAQDVDLESSEARAGYSIGVNIGMNLDSQGIAENVDTEALMAGIRDALNGELKLSQDEIVASIQDFSSQLQAEAQAQQQQQAQEQAQAGQDFLAENAQRDEVTTTDSGLQYMVMEESEQSNAPSPSADDTVNVHYHGTLLDGTVFDSSVERGEPVSFPLGSVIPGWTEGLQLMQVGDKYRFFVPSDLAYGDAGTGPIPPSATLIFEVELLGIDGEDGE